MATQHARVDFKVGIYARSTSVIAEHAFRFQEEVLIEFIDSPEPDNKPVDASSTLMLMALGAGYDDEVAVTSISAVAIGKIARLIAQDLSN